MSESGSLPPVVEESCLETAISSARPNLHWAIPELLLHIAQFADPASLAALVHTCKPINGVLTPSLYAEIIPDGRLEPMLACLETLSRPPQQNSFARDLAGFVRRFHFDNEPIYTSLRNEKRNLGEWLLIAVSRMIHLESFAWIGNLNYVPQTLQVLATFLGGKHPAPLRYLAMIAPGRGLYPTIDAWEPGFIPTLTTFKVVLSGYNLSTVSGMIQRFLDTSAETIRVLSFTTPSSPKSLDDCSPWRPSSGDLLSVDVTFPVLEELEVAEPLLSRCLWEGSPLRRAPRLRALTIREFTRPCIWFECDPDDFPNIEALSCSLDMLFKFLPASFASPRPIRSVTVHHSDRSLATWSDIFNGLSQLQYSAAPVRKLSFHVWKRPSLDNLGTAMAMGHLQSLEHLAIVLRGSKPTCEYEEYLSGLGPSVFARLRHLRTFSLQDYYKPPADQGDEEVTMQRRVFLGYEDHPSLTKITFFTRFAWVKRQTGWECAV